MAVQAHSPRDALSRLEAMTMMAAEAPGRGAREIVAHLPRAKREELKRLLSEPQDKGNANR